MNIQTYQANEMIVGRGHYTPTEMWAKGSKYGPMQSDGYDYLCPDCGGYGYILDKDSCCGFCNGLGTISLQDPRITSTKPSVNNQPESFLEETP